jgi:hypothetical protein
MPGRHKPGSSCGTLNSANPPAVLGVNTHRCTWESESSAGTVPSLNTARVEAGDVGGHYGRPERLVALLPAVLDDPTDRGLHALYLLGTVGGWCG